MAGWMAGGSGVAVGGVERVAGAARAWRRARRRAWRRHGARGAHRQYLAQVVDEAWAGLLDLLAHELTARGDGCLGAPSS
eukprot:7363561-Prymnesium_polylepis.1